MLGPIYLFVSAIEPHALVNNNKSMQHSDVGRIKNLLEKNDPRRLRDGEVRHLNVTERDLNLMLDYALRRVNRQSSAIDLGVDSARINYSYLLPDNPIGNYFNVSLVLKQADKWLEVKQIALGQTLIPGSMLNPVIKALDKF